MQNLLLVTLVGACATAVAVYTGFDWAYFVFVSAHIPRALLYSTDIVGLFVPIVFPLFLLISAYIYKERPRATHYRRDGLCMLQSVTCAYFFTLFLKALSGRDSPPDHTPLALLASHPDTSNGFHFGFMQGEMLGGWPSSHTAVSFALAACVHALYPNNKPLVCAAYMYALCIGLGITFGFHWFSEFLAGAGIGVCIGMAVTRSYTKRTHS
jgi:membrane-associated phospholipid phosphatase